MAKYSISSVKKSTLFVGPLSEAILVAAEMNADLQPAYGVQVVNEGGDVVHDTEWPIFPVRTDAGTESVRAEDFDAACEKADEIAAKGDGAWARVYDVDGDYYDTRD